MEGMARADGAVTQMTVQAVPVFGGISQDQFDIWKIAVPWFDTLTANENG